ncbi:MAG: ABC transporter ATP-binding protein [bacterium]
MTTAILAQGIRKAYADFEALKGVDLEVPVGEVFALLGPNGAGKTTLVEILEGFRERTSGAAEVLGVDPMKANAEWRARVGVVLQSAGFFEALTPLEAVKHFATFYPAPLDPTRVIEMVGLTEKKDARLRSLSGGQKRRVDLALGIVGDPEVIFLDEPTTGLDPQGRRQIWDVVTNFAHLGKTILLTTHYLDEAEHLANRVGVIIKGDMVEVGSPREIGGRQRANATVAFAARGALAGVPLPAGIDCTREGEVISISTFEPTRTLALLTEWAETSAVTELPELSITRPSLEDIYLKMVAAADAEDAS